jgi:hypothetical protein
VCAVLSDSIYGPVLNNEKNLSANLLNVVVYGSFEQEARLHMIITAELYRSFKKINGKHQVPYSNMFGSVPEIVQNFSF